MRTHSELWRCALENLLPTINTPHGYNSCKFCGNSLPRNPSGRSREYCDESCRAKYKRQSNRQVAAAKKRRSVTKYAEGKKFK
jgi:hypothetical protein